MCLFCVKFLTNKIKKEHRKTKENKNVDIKSNFRSFIFFFNSSKGEKRCHCLNEFILCYDDLRVTRASENGE